jgi:NAD(P)-dependent dehydrogenase (short-subunit alcohol dehydrogenase family)
MTPDLPSASTTGRVAGKVALVTGAASGIGQATARVLAQQGAAVFCADVNTSGADETAKQITAAGGAAWACALDVTSEAAWERAIEQAVRERGRLDILVNCAGIAAAAPIAETTLEDWRRVMAVNLEGAFLGTKHAVRVMRQTSRAGSIVHVSSVSGLKAQPGAAAYCASKAALIMLSRTAALECLRGGDPIRVNTVSPSGVKTPMWKTQPFFQELMEKEGGEEAAFQAMVRDAPYGRFALPEEVALAIVYLASDESLYVTGTDLAIDNGDTA